jgi:hypothetical protein
MAPIPIETAGYTPGPDTRGTLDILWTCLGVLFLCSWSILRLNIPRSTDSDWHIFWRKIKWMLVGLLAPEFLTSIALYQFYNVYKLRQYVPEKSFTQAWYYYMGMPLKFLVGFQAG